MFLYLAVQDEDTKASEEVTDRSSPEWTNPGWTMLSACTIWKRMLGVLGNISLIRDPLILAEAVKCIEEVWKRLMEVFPLHTQLVYTHISSKQSFKIFINQSHLLGCSQSCYHFINVYSKITIQLVY